VVATFSGMIWLNISRIFSSLYRNILQHTVGVEKGMSLYNNNNNNNNNNNINNTIINILSCLLSPSSCEVKNCGAVRPLPHTRTYHELDRTRTDCCLT
jgi:hypothetical protein